MTEWHKFPEVEPQFEGVYLVALDFPDGDFCVDTGGWEPELKRWVIDPFYDDEVNPLDAGSVVKAWMPMPEFPRKLIWG